METSENWSALLQTIDGLQLPNETLTRAIYGKAEGARIDYRILAKSNDFTIRLQKIAKIVYFGDITQAKKLFAWSVKNGIKRAIHAYPSQARDATNRGGFLERQILASNAIIKKNTPLILYILAMLQRVAKYNDSDWWHTKNKNEWDRKNFYIKLQQDNAILEEEMTQAKEILLKQALPKIKEKFSRIELIKFYENILEKSPFITPQTNNKQTVKIEELIALFLPLEEKYFSHLSFTTALTDTDAERYPISDKLTQTWNIIPNVKYNPITHTTPQKITAKATIFANAIINQHPPTPAQLKNISSPKKLNKTSLIQEEKQKTDENLIVNKKHKKYSNNSNITNPTEKSHKNKIEEKKTSPRVKKEIKKIEPAERIKKPSEPFLSLFYRTSFYKILTQKNLLPYKNDYKEIEKLFKFLCSIDEIPKISLYINETISKKNKLLLKEWKNELNTKLKYDKLKKPMPADVQEKINYISKFL